MKIGDPVQIINPNSGFYLKLGTIEKENSKGMIGGWKVIFQNSTGCRKQNWELRLILNVRVKLNKNIKEPKSLTKQIGEIGEIKEVDLNSNYPLYVKLSSGIYRYLKLEEVDFLECNYRNPDPRLINWLRC